MQRVFRDDDDQQVFWFGPLRGRLEYPLTDPGTAGPGEAILWFDEGDRPIEAGETIHWYYVGPRDVEDRAPGQLAAAGEAQS